MKRRVLKKQIDKDIHTQVWLNQYDTTIYAILKNTLNYKNVDEIIHSDVMKILYDLALSEMSKSYEIFIKHHNTGINQFWQCARIYKIGKRQFVNGFDWVTIHNLSFHDSLYKFYKQKHNM